MAKSYYLILGVDDNATQGQIKSAYRNLVKELHPDHYGPDSEPFREIQEAYSVLGDPERRQAYDKQVFGRMTQRSPGGVYPESSGSRSPIEPVEPSQRPGVEEVFLTRSFETYSPSFEEVFDRLRRNFFDTGHPKAERLRSLRIEVTLTPEQARRAGEARVRIPVHLRCPSCRGAGGIGFFDCWRCSGHGTIDEEVPVRIPYPATVANNHVVRVPLDRLGIRNFYLEVCFRVSESTS